MVQGQPGALWQMVLLSPPPSSKLKGPHARCSWKWVPDPLQTPVMERVALVFSLTSVVMEKWRKIHSTPLAAGESWSEIRPL